MKGREASAPTSPASPSPAGGLRLYLYVTAGVTGAAIMIIEILGAKILAPWFGTSHFVWTAQIAVTLVALAAGYYAGGRLVGGSARLGRLYGAIVVAAGYLALAVAVREWVAYLFLQLPLAAGSLLSSVFLFFAPLSLLAMTGPFLVRVLTSAVSEVGGNVGRLTSVSTMGSFVGTLAIGYVLIPLLPNSATMDATAALLAVIGICYFLVWRRRASTLAGLAVIVAVGLASGAWGTSREGFRNPSLVEIYRGNSNFGLLQVLQQRDRPYRYYLTDYLIQNTYDVTQGRSVSMFTYMLQGLARAYTPRLQRVLCIGMGVGIVPRELAREGAAVDVVEINPDVVPVAEKYFDLDPKGFRLFIADGRQFLNTSTERYDAVILDAFNGDSSPSHLMTREAFMAIRRALNPDGVLVMNSFADLDPSDDYAAASLARTLRSVFPSLRVHGVRGGNTLFVASPRAELAFLKPPSFAEVHPDALDEVRAAFNTLWEPDPGHGVVLTDDHNPIEFYDAANRERYRRTLALSMRNR
ncbi:MAG: fused MFS/spermidine synthase [Spirochaetia bacterium]|jgi:predicted membrane-bound spermidine synthase